MSKNPNTALLQKKEQTLGGGKEKMASSLMRTRNNFRSWKVWQKEKRH